ncbi:MAG: NIPSNAP family protein [Terriglobia bacterium]
MNRRSFLASSAAASTFALGNPQSDLRGSETSADSAGREYYVLRRYQLSMGPQEKLTDDFLKGALVPSLNRLGIKPVGVFHSDIGPESPSFYVLIPSASLETLANVDFLLERDANYLQAGAPFLNAPATAPAYIRAQSSLMKAFEGFPKLVLPAATAARTSRVFELRIYESPSDAAHRRKVEMFNQGEFDIFQEAGFWQVFYGDTLVGPKMPNLTYMIGFPDLTERNKMWQAFGSSAAWKKLSTDPRYSYEEIVSSITNIVLSPTAYSQI